MKECPTCRLLFADGSLRFCRYDGTPLVIKAVRSDEAVTLLFSTGQLNDKVGPVREMRRRKGETEERSGPS